MEMHFLYKFLHEHHKSQSYKSCDVNSALFANVLCFKLNSQLWMDSY